VSSYRVGTGPVTHSASYPVDAGVLCSGWVLRPESVDDLSLSSGIEIKNAWRFTSRICLNGVELTHRDNFAWIVYRVSYMFN
jgi:hypothetical protein